MLASGQCKPTVRLPTLAHAHAHAHPLYAPHRLLPSQFVSTLVDYVSCSPLRVPIARLAAAQAAIKRAQKPGGNDHCQD